MPPQTNSTHSFNDPSWFQSKTSLPLTVEPLKAPPPSLRSRLSLLFAALHSLFLGFSTTVASFCSSIYHAIHFATVGLTTRASPTSNPASPLHKQPPSEIVEAFHEFIQNDMPARLIDTSKLMFVERNAVFDFFFSEIAKITDEDITNRMRTIMVDMHPETGIYVTQARRKAALRKIILDVLQYAIFSHRWTESEPTYQEVSPLLSSARPTLGKQRNHKTPGLAKLVQLCNTAHSLGYKLVWSDTCCIDKSNAVELSEAIRAMFKWYTHAHVCIVHLGSSLSLEDFEYDPWFKRGWTLQELLAPRRIKFYSQAWLPLTRFSNDKDDHHLMTVLSSVTGIPRDVVVADNTEGVKGHSIGEIMSWASPRKTTRTEDTAYCLFGLFNVSIPVLYGEGDKAFPRLLKAIMARRPSWDIFAWAGQASKDHPALPHSPACYPKWDCDMTSGGMGMKFSWTRSHGLCLTSVPLIPMDFAEEVEERNGSYRATLRPRVDDERALGRFSNVYVDCGKSRLAQIHAATDLHVCVLNYQQSLLDRGELKVGRTYVCFLLHKKSPSPDGWTWLKFATDNVLRIDCTGVLDIGSTRERKEGVFDVQLQTTHVRWPRAQSMPVA